MNTTTLLRMLGAGLGCVMAGTMAWAESLRLEGGIVHTVSGPSLTNQPVLVRDGRIAAVGSEAAAGAADKTVDVRGLHLFPGLIAAGSILGLVEIDSIRASIDSVELGEYTPDVHSWIAVNPESELIPVARANGFTHAQVVPVGGVLSGQSSLIRLEGWTIEDLAENRALGIHLFWPSFNLQTGSRGAGPGPDRGRPIDDQVKEREKRLREIDGFFDEAQAYLKARRAAGFTNRAPLPTEAASGRPAGVVATNGFVVVPAWESLVPLLEKQAPLFLHADETRQIRSAVDWARKRALRTVLVGGRDAARLGPFLATNEVSVIYERLFTLPPRDTDPYDVQFSAPARLREAGVTVAFGEGTDRFGASNVRNLPYVAAQAMAFGLPREEAWRGLTLNAARILGVADRLGSIEAGKDATLIAVDGDILDIRSNVKRMWIGGREVSLESRHTRLYEKYRNRPRK